MNFLAHLFLSGNNEEVIIGNFIADHVKGKAIAEFPPGIITGIHFHRFIDTFTDAHPVFRRSVNRLTQKYGKYAGVIADMFYDHFLSANWSDYSPEDLDIFTQRMFEIIVFRYDILPLKTKRLITFLYKENWLKAYGTFEGIDRALKGMSRRTPFESGMEKAVDDLKSDYNDYLYDFQVFFPEIIKITHQKLHVLSTSYPDR